MPSITPPPELTKIIDDLKRRLFGAHVTGIQITPRAQGLAVVGHIIGQQCTAEFRRCCDDVSRRCGIDIFVTCALF